MALVVMMDTDLGTWNRLGAIPLETEVTSVN